MPPSFRRPGSPILALLAAAVLLAGRSPASAGTPAGAAPHGIEAGWWPEAAADYPETDIWKVGYAYWTPRLRHSVTAGYGTLGMVAGTTRLTDAFWLLQYACHVPVYRTFLGQLLLGAEGGSFLVRQLVEEEPWFGEGPIERQVTWTFFPQAGAAIGLEIFLPGPLWLSPQASLGFHRVKRGSGRGFTLAPHAMSGIAIGFRF